VTADTDATTTKAHGPFLAIATATNNITKALGPLAAAVVDILTSFG